MRYPLSRLSLIAVALTRLAPGCSTKPSQIMAPDVQLSSARAPLYNRAPGARYVAGSYIVVLKESVRDVDLAVDDLGLRHAFKSHFRYKHALKGFAGSLSPAVVESLRSDPRVAYIEKDQVACVAGTDPNPPSWGLDRIDQRSLPLDHAFSYNQTGAGVDAFIIDTGIRTTHVDFGGRAVAGVDAVTPGGTADDGNGHGTAVAGTVGGTLCGVAKSVRLIAVRVLGNDGTGYYSQILAGIDWVTANHTSRPAVANMSISGTSSTALNDAVRRSIAAGVTYCIAAGNVAADASGFSPGGVAEAITVGATGSSDTFASFSNTGSVVDILAPGVDIVTDWHSSNTATSTQTGTSMAAPHVTGAAAMYLEANPKATPAAVSSALVASASANLVSGVPSGTPNRLLYSVYGTAPAPTAPLAPALNSPAENATGVPTSTALLWSPSAGAQSYRVQVSTRSNFASMVIDQSGLTTTATGATDLAGSTLHYWRVAASNAQGTSPWSPVWSFTTTAPPSSSPPPAPTLYFPRNGATGVSASPTLQWNAATGASSYRVQISTTSAFATTVTDRSGITTTSVAVAGLVSGTRYYWRAYAASSAGSSPWSTTWSFTTAGTAPPVPPSTPTLVSPENGATSVSRAPTFEWNSSTGATSYRIQVSARPAFSTLVHDQSGITSTSTTTAKLGAGTTYYWRVNATSSSGTSNWSAVWSFKTWGTRVLLGRQ